MVLLRLHYTVWEEVRHGFFNKKEMLLEYIHQYQSVTNAYPQNSQRVTFTFSITLDDCSRHLVAASSPLADTLPTIGWNTSAQIVTNGWSDQIFKNIDPTFCGPVSSCVLR